jgi:hypothetical protein
MVVVQHMVQDLGYPLFCTSWQPHLSIGKVENFRQRLHKLSLHLRAWLLLLVVVLVEEAQQGLQNFRVRKQR